MMLCNFQGWVITSFCLALSLRTLPFRNQPPWCEEIQIDLANIFLLFLETQSLFPSPQPPPNPRALEAEAQARACVFGMWAFFGTITLLGTAIPSALRWPLPAFLWPSRRPLPNCPGFPAVSLCSAPEKGLWPARPNALGAARVALAPGVTPGPELTLPQGSLRLTWGARAADRKSW